jgi:pimeloyl-ACP methyl ester carboxylesterase
VAANSDWPVPLVILLHGLGATGAVWHGVAAELGATFNVLAPDLPGHGAADSGSPYSVGHLAAAVAAVLPPTTPWYVAGHSLGGYVAVALASGWFGNPPLAALSLGAKLRFTQAERARAADMTRRPASCYRTRAEATARYRRVAGLPPSMPLDDSHFDRGVRADADGFRLNHDPASYGIVGPSFRALLSVAVSPVFVVRGELDPMVTRLECEELPAPFEELSGLGHNAHVEHPELTAALLRRVFAR